MRNKKIYTSICIVVMILTMTLAMVACDARNLPRKVTLDLSDYELTFSDNFDTLDTSKWKIGLKNGNYIRNGAYYTDDDDTVFVKDSALTIRTQYKEGKYGTGWYTAWLDTATTVNENQEVSENYKGFSQTYGYFEARCKVPKAIGIWSAFWMMPDGAKGMTTDDEIGTGSDGVEIDIMESPWAYSNPAEANMHVLHGDGYKDTQSDRSPKYKVKGMYEEYHTYGLMWTDEEYIFYIDGKETWRSKHTVNGKELGVSRVNEYMILSVEVSGKDGVEGDMWCGNPIENDKSAVYDFQVDYVKAYIKK